MVSLNLRHSVCKHWPSTTQRYQLPEQAAYVMSRPQIKVCTHTHTTHIHCMLMHTQIFIGKTNPSQVLHPHTPLHAHTRTQVNTSSLCLPPPSLSLNTHHSLKADAVEVLSSTVPDDISGAANTASTPGLDLCHLALMTSTS